MTTRKLDYSEPTRLPDCDGNHVGRCSAREGLQLWHRDQATQALQDAGFRFVPETAEWVRDSDGAFGRFAYSPDFCWQGVHVTPYGTEFWLRGHAPGSVNYRIDLAEERS